jgi:hypothetical protein
MADPKDDAKAEKEAAKAAKKAAKAQAKLQKKAAEGGGPEPTPTVQGAPVAQDVPGDGKLTPAERSAIAAERQVALQRFRVLFALMMLLVAAATFIATVRPWRFFEDPEPPVEPPAATAADEPA